MPSELAENCSMTISRSSSTECSSCEDTVPIVGTFAMRELRPTVMGLIEKSPSPSVWDTERMIAPLGAIYASSFCMGAESFRPSAVIVTPWAGAFLSASAPS